MARRRWVQDPITGDLIEVRQQQPSDDAGTLIVFRDPDSAVEYQRALRSMIETVSVPLTVTPPVVVNVTSRVPFAWPSGLKVWRDRKGRIVIDLPMQMVDCEFIGRTIEQPKGTGLTRRLPLDYLARPTVDGFRPRSLRKLPGSMLDGTWWYHLPSEDIHWIVDQAWDSWVFTRVSPEEAMERTETVTRSAWRRSVEKQLRMMSPPERNSILSGFEKKRRDDE